MKHIRKHLLLTVLLMQSFYLFAQDDSPFQFGIRTGLNLYSTSLKADNITKKVKLGYQVGLSAEYQFSENSFYLQTGVDLMKKGTTLVKEVKLEGGGTHEWRQSIDMQYLQIPLMAVTKMEVDSDTKVYFRLGPYIAFGIGGKTTQSDKYKDVDKENEENKQDTFGDNGLKDLDYGIRFGSGLEFDKFIVGLEFEYGLANINQSSNELGATYKDNKFKNKGVNISLGYKF